MFLCWLAQQFISHFDVDERYYFGLKTVFGCLDHDDELLAHLRPYFQSNLLLEFLRDGVLTTESLHRHLLANIGWSCRVVSSGGIHCQVSKHILPSSSFSALLRKDLSFFDEVVILLTSSRIIEED